MFGSWNLQPLDVPENKEAAVTRQLRRLLAEQQRLLELPMTGADVLLYEIRSDRINDLVAQLIAQDSAFAGSQF
jgi:hypothetical protein